MVLKLNGESFTYDLNPGQGQNPTHNDFMDTE